MSLDTGNIFFKGKKGATPKERAEDALCAEDLRAIKPIPEPKPTEYQARIPPHLLFSVTLQSHQAGLKLLCVMQQTK